MAQKNQPLLFVCRSCRSQLKRSKIDARTFTSTAQRSRVIPSFTPTSNAELDELFVTFRSKVFTPSALAKHHRDLIYKQSRHQILLNDPGVTVTLSNDEEVRLMPMNQRERPNKHQSLKRLAELLAETDDPQRWSNLPAFLEGMKMAHLNVPDSWLEAITRKANEVGRTGVIKSCADMVKRTGVSLARQPVTRELVLGYRMKVAKAGVFFKGGDDAALQSSLLQDALKKVESVALMMESALHCGGKLKEGQVDMRRDLTVLGILLELSAAKAVHVDGGKDTTTQNTVAGYVVKMLAYGKDEPFNLTDDPYHVGHELESRIPLWNGIRLALKVDGVSAGPHGSALRAMEARLSRAIREAKAIVEKDANGKPRRCLNMLAEIQG